jgi:hypothetical protein
LRPPEQAAELAEPTERRTVPGCGRHAAAPLVFCAAGAVCLLGWLLRHSASGLDFTDESYYIVSMSNPYAYGATTTQFGFIYHSLYWLTGGSIPHIRQANVLITFALAWALVTTFLTETVSAITMPPVARLAIAGGFASSSLILFDNGIQTPSYNSLSLQALLIVATGLLLAKPSASPASISGWALIGAGGWLAFMAKPTTALAAAGISAVYLYAAAKLNGRLLLLSMVIAVSLLGLSALMLDGSVTAFGDRLRLGAELGGLLGGGHTFGSLVRLDSFQLGARGTLALWAAAALPVLSFHLGQSNSAMLRMVSLGCLAFMLSVTMALSADLTLATAGLGAFQGMLIWAEVIASIVLGLTVCRRQFLGLMSAGDLAAAGALAAFPHAFAFGTNINYWNAGSSAGLFWLISGLAFATPAARRQGHYMVFLPLALATQMITAILLQTGFAEPYRQTQPLPLNKAPVEIGGGAGLLLSAGYASYIEDAEAGGKKAGLLPGTPVIDMTGQSPGIVYAMQAENLGQAWMIGGYKGSLELAIEMLKRVPCEKLADAWLLTEPAGKRKIPNDLLASFGADLNTDYMKAGAWITAAGAGSYPEQRAQELLEPTRAPSLAIAACNASPQRRAK